MPRRMKEFEPGHGFTKEDWEEVSDNPELTDEELAQGRPFREVFPEFAKAIDKQLARARGRQKSPTKELISLRVDRDTLAAYRATGPGWQKRMNDALRANKPALAKG